MEKAILHSTNLQATPTIVLDDSGYTSATPSSSRSVPSSQKYPLDRSWYSRYDFQNLLYSPESHAHVPGSLVGSDQIDFISLFIRKNDFHVILNLIFSYLQPPDICNMMAVSKSWYNLCMSNPTALRIRSNYLFAMKASKENLVGGYMVTKNIESGSHLRGLFRSIQNILPAIATPQRSPPVSPSKARFKLFVKEGNKLQPGERLGRCPRCSLPSHIMTNNIGQCSRMTCLFRFCNLCWCEAHENRQCPVTPLPHVRKSSVSISSKRSKKNLRRLL